MFSPNKVPDGYADVAAIALVLRPGAFRANAIDVAGLYRHTRATAPRYHEIAAPTVVISGDMDTVVDEQIHSHRAGPRHQGRRTGLGAQSRPQAGLDRAGTRRRGIENAAGGSNDLQALARRVEQRIAGDAYGDRHLRQGEGARARTARRS